MNYESDKMGRGAMPPENMDLKLRIQNMREFDIAKALSKKREFGDNGAAAEMYEISQRPDEYYIDLINQRNRGEQK
ncbi:MAG: hypothetical protein HZA25_00195 [Candidatus Niyogibacteria bacterium]|nr:hypothetical protein [Candidatus Niyogibacteria bacterium]